MLKGWKVEGEKEEERGSSGQEDGEGLRVRKWEKDRVRKKSWGSERGRKVEVEAEEERLRPRNLERSRRAKISGK
jgi:hypothetical protein